MKKMNLVLFLMFTLVGAKAQEAVQLSDLVGKWKLTKVEEVEMQGDTELSRREYAVPEYSGTISIKNFECFANGSVAYEATTGEPENTGNIQLARGANRVIFHNRKQRSYPFDFTWQTKPTSFSIEAAVKRNQQTKEKTVVRFFYERQQ